MKNTLGKTKQTEERDVFEEGSSRRFRRQEFMTVSRSRMIPMKFSNKSASHSIESNMWSLPTDEDQL